MDVTTFYRRSDWRRCLIAVAIGMILVVTTDVPAAGAQTATPSDPASIVVFKLEGDAASDQLRNSLTGAMRDQVQNNPRYQLVNDEPATLSDVIVVLGCDSASTTCLGKAADHFGADYLIFGKFEDASGSNRVSVRLFDPGRGRYVRSFGRVLKQLNPPYQSFREEVDALLKTDSQREKVTSLRVTSNVQGAKVRLNGQLAGKTPMERRGISPGQYRVEVLRGGYRTWKTVIQLDEGGSVNLQATLEEKPEPSREATSSTSSGTSGGPGPAADMEPADKPPPSAQTAKTANWGPWVAIGMGAASFAGSAIAWERSKQARKKLDRYREGEDIPPRDECVTSEEKEICKEGRNATAATNILIGVGSVSAAGGVAWLLFRNTGGEGESAVRRLDVSWTGTGIRANWRW